MEENSHFRKTLEHYRQQRQQKLDDVLSIKLMIRQLERDLREAPSTDIPAGMTEDSTANLPPLVISPLFSVRPDELRDESK